MSFNGGVTEIPRKQHLSFSIVTHIIGETPWIES